MPSEPNENNNDEPKDECREDDIPTVKTEMPNGHNDVDRGDQVISAEGDDDDDAKSEVREFKDFNTRK